MFFGLQICDERIVIDLFSYPINDFFQFASVSGNQLFFKLAGLKFYGDIIVVRGYKPVAALKMRDRHCLGFGKVKDIQAFSFLPVF